jgi:hypothetical protein
LNEVRVIFTIFGGAFVSTVGVDEDKGQWLLLAAQRHQESHHHYVSKCQHFNISKHRDGTDSQLSHPQRNAISKTTQQQHQHVITFPSPIGSTVHHSCDINHLHVSDQQHSPDHQQAAVTQSRTPVFPLGFDQLFVSDK